MAAILFILLFLSISATGVLAYLELPLQWWVVPALSVFSILVTFAIWRVLILPRNIVRNGLYLIAAQDFSSRLRKVNEPESDRIVRLFNDMIERLHNERLQNLERESFLHLLVEASPMGVAIADFDGKLALVNSSFRKIAGLPEDLDLIGLRIDELPSEIAEEMSSVPLGRTGVISSGDMKRYRLYHNSFIQTGFPREFFMLEDISTEVRHAERMAYEKVIRTISHEVNNTMGGVRSLLDMLLDFSHDSDLRDVIASCDTRCGRMCEFVDSYADVVRVPDPVMNEGNLNKELKEMLPFLRMSYGSAEITFEMGDGDMRANYDSGMIQQVMVNVVKNAVESMKDGKGRVVISTRRDAHGVTVDIANDGAPIPPEVASNLFHPFFTTKSSGRGLGLTLVSEILARHESRFSLRTLSDGLTHFRMTF